MSIKVIDGDGLEKHYETIGDGTVASPFQAVVPDATISYAENEIFKKFGDRVSVFEKGKRILKYGRNSDIDTSLSETIWEVGQHENLQTSNTINIVRSTNVADTQQVVIEGHTISGNDLTFVEQTATLSGTNIVFLTTPLARVNRLYNIGSTDFAGDITVEQNAGDTHIKVLGTQEKNQSAKCQTAISKDDYYIVYQISGGIIGTISANVSFAFQTRKTGQRWLTKREFKTNNYTEVPLNPPLIVEKNTDVRVIGKSDTLNTEAIAEFAGYLAKIIV